MTEEQIPYESGNLPVPIGETAPVPILLFGSDDPQAIIASATARADVLADVIKQRQLYVMIGNREYVKVEGWTLLGALLGVFPIPVWTHPMENGWEARVEARTLSGVLVGAAEAQCLREEKSWANRDDFALRSMAQTRATAKALRLPLGFVMALAGYETTPAEEMVAEKAITPRPTAPNKQAAGVRLTAGAAVAAPDAVLQEFIRLRKEAGFPNMRTALDSLGIPANWSEMSLGERDRAVADLGALASKTGQEHRDGENAIDD